LPRGFHASPWWGRPFGLPSQMARLVKRNEFEGDPNDIAGMDWSREWSE
jgi:hypothetical protein